MMRRTPLRSRSTLQRKTRIRARGNTAYRRRERDFEFMGWVKRQPCMVRELPPHTFVRDLALRARFFGEAVPAATPCRGPVEADHQGARGMGQKADDRTCVAMCQLHHQQRHAHNGAFKYLTRDELRAWRAAAIQRTQDAWSKR